MARPVRIGSVLQFAITSSANTGTVSSTITVPDGTTFVVATISGFQGTASGFAAMTFTKGGADTAMTKASPAGDASGSTWQGAIFYMTSPDVGTNKSLKWDWIGAGASADPSLLFTLTFWQNVNLANPVREAKAVQAGATPFIIPEISTSEDDVVFAAASAFAASEGTSGTLSNLNLLTELTKSNEGDGALFIAPLAGPARIAVETDTNWDDGGLSAISIRGIDSSRIHISRRPVDDEGSGWIEELTQVSGWYGDIQITAWFDPDFVSDAAAGGQTITSVKFNNTNTFGTSIISRGAVTITGVLFVDADVFRTAVITTTYTITGVRFTDADSFGTAVVGRGAVTITGVRFNDADSFGVATITRGAVTISGSLFVDPDIFHTAALTSSYSIVGQLFVDGDTFGTATVGRGAVGITGLHFSDPDIFHTAVVTADSGAQDITAALFTDADVFHSALVRGLNTIQSSRFVDPDVFGNNTIAAGTYNVLAAHFSNSNTFHIASLTGGDPPVIGNGSGGWLRRRRR